MAKQAIALGNSANDGLGDGLRGAGAKINDNFTELYGARGSWTPRVLGGTTPGSATYASRSGYHVRINTMVWAWFSIQLASTSGMTGYVLMDGLPVEPSISISEFAGSLSFYDGINFPAGASVLGVRVRGGANDNAMFLAMGGASPGVGLQSSNLTASARIQGVLIYEGVAL